MIPTLWTDNFAKGKEVDIHNAQADFAYICEILLLFFYKKYWRKRNITLRSCAIEQIFLGFIVNMQRNSARQ